MEPKVEMKTPAGALAKDAITIGEALEVAALSAGGGKPVDQSDAGAIQAAETRALGCNITLTPPTGIGVEAQKAAARNARILSPSLKTTIADVLGDTKSKLPVEIRNKADMAPTPGGVAESAVSAARFNQDKSDHNADPSE